jgi:hypothetical protein
MAASLCANGENLGTPAASCGYYKPATWKDDIHTLCKEESQKLSTCRAAMDHK